MAQTSIWIIKLDDDEGAAQQAARSLQPYGLAIKGQRWSQDPKAWLVSADEAAQAGAAVVLLTGTVTAEQQRATARGLALFRLCLQTRRQRPINGFFLSGPLAAPSDAHGTALLQDWTPLEGGAWPARLTARAHAPKAPDWPVQLGLYAHERLGVWLETHPQPGRTAPGALVGVSGNAAAIDFHAVGPAGQLPERTVNEYELQGLEFDAAGQHYMAWAVQNTIAPDHRYFVRLDGEPDRLAIGTLPDGTPGDVSLITVG